MKQIGIILLFCFSCVFADNGDCESLFQSYAGTDKEREIFVIVDQSTPFPEKIRKNTLINIFSIIKPKTTVNLFTFSEYTKGKYISLVDRYYFYNSLSENQRYELGKKVIKRFDQCHQAYENGMKRKLASDIYDHFKEDGHESSKSEILYSLKKISENAVKVARAKEKIVFILSDMLENSNYTSFYGKELKHLNIDKHLNIIRQNRLFGDFDGADIIVVGAGLVDNETYRDGQDKDRLKTLWTDYFAASNAKLRIFATEIAYPIKDMY